jgi:hypothetical protein
LVQVGIAIIPVGAMEVDLSEDLAVVVVVVDLVAAVECLAGVAPPAVGNSLQVKSE